ncbi:hypothetical protein V8E53_013343 [Lactarius tabidus]
MASKGTRGRAQTLSNKAVCSPRNAPEESQEAYRGLFLECLWDLFPSGARQFGELLSLRISHGCAEKETADEMGFPTQGKRLGIHEYWEHSRADKHLRYLGEAHLNSLAMVHQREDNVSLDTHQASGNVPQDAATSSLAPQAGHRSELSARVTSQEDAIAKSLEACLSIFRSGLLQDIHIEDLVFCKPSDEDDPHSPPPLQSLTKANTQFLQYRDWMTKMFNDAHSMNCSSFERCRSIKDQLLNDLQNEWVRLDDLKLRAWQMALHNNSAMASLSNPGPTTSDLDSTQVIDTSLHFEMPLLSSDIQPIVIVVYILVAVMHIVSGLSLRDCGQLLLTLKLLINLMVEDFHTADGQDSYPELCLSKDPLTQ